MQSGFKVKVDEQRAIKNIKNNENKEKSNNKDIEKT